MDRLNQLSTQNPLNEPALIKCVWMDAGVVDYKLCDRSYDCEHCPFDEALHGPRAELFSPDESSSLNGCHLGRGLFYHPSHLWMRVEDRGELRIGLDDFGQRLLGAFYSMKLPPSEEEIKVGDSCCRIALQSGIVTLLSPLSGRITETNLNLPLQPSLVNRDPYGDGWMILVQPTNLETCLRQLLYGEKVREWLADEIHKLRLLLNSFTYDEYACAVTMNDGGLLTPELLKGLSVEQTRRVISSFFSFSSVDEAKNKSAIVVPDRR